MSREIEHSESESDTLFYPNSRRVNRIDTDTSSDNENVGSNKNDQKGGRNVAEIPGNGFEMLIHAPASLV
ncbi:hypothetical protein TNCT_149801 [Trichonephila clavata]|uniref:Uncharacterized protein n=1 Tax=Trichonephila clavata TaxID=2740835 RepID=A0A8X6FTX9_TRICU|nr:hypothetical protein TNCT_149801 [Trichonephila clavata]